MNGYVYIIQSLKSNYYYIGSAHNVANRLKQHNGGQVKATVNRRSWVLVFHQPFEDFETAQKVERKLKSWKRRDFLEKIIRDGEIVNL